VCESARTDLVLLAPALLGEDEVLLDVLLRHGRLGALHGAHEVVVGPARWQ